MTELSSDEARVLGALDEAALIEGLVELVRIPSITGTAAESDLQQRQAAELTRYGFDVDTWQLDLDALRADPRFPGAEAERTERVRRRRDVGGGDGDQFAGAGPARPCRRRANRRSRQVGRP